MIEYISHKRHVALIIIEELDRIFPEDMLPFLNHNDFFQLLIGVILSAQCSDNRVNEVTKILFDVYPSPRTMAHGDLLHIEQIIRPCGFYKNKARFIKETAHMIHYRFNDLVPTSMDSLLCLPGVGEKTAKVVLSFMEDNSVFPVDRHIMRCAHRWQLSNSPLPNQISRELELIFPASNRKNIHLKILAYARSVCTARNHTKEQCVICSKTNAFWKTI